MDLRSANLFKLIPNESIVCVRCLQEWRINVAATYRLIHAGEIEQLCSHHANKEACTLMLGGNSVVVSGASPTALALPLPYDVDAYLTERKV
jgi:hypothetical protein